LPAVLSLPLTDTTVLAPVTLLPPIGIVPAAVKVSCHCVL
jgi:hypothetical protein